MSDQFTPTGSMPEPDYGQIIDAVTYYRDLASTYRAQRDGMWHAVSPILAADDDFRASMAPDVEKDPVTIACDAAREAIGKLPNDPTAPWLKEP